MRTARTGSSSRGASGSTRRAGSRALECRRGGAPHERVAVLQARAGRVDAAGAGTQARDRGRPRDGRLVSVAGHRREQLAGAGRSGGGRAERLGVALIAARRAPVPGLHLLGRPCGRAIRVASRARVRHAEGDREIGTGDPEAVVVARVDDHVGGGGHVAAADSRRRASPWGGSDAWPRCTSAPSGSRGTPGSRARGACRCAGRGSPSTSRRGGTSCSGGTSRTRTPRRGSARRGSRGGPRGAPPGGCRRAAARAHRRRRTGPGARGSARTPPPPAPAGRAESAGHCPSPR